MSDSRKKYEEMVEDGKIKQPFYKSTVGKIFDGNINYRELYDEFVEEHGDPNNTTLFVDFLESKLNK